jgi:hypothetical protein
MAWTSPRTWVASEIVTAAVMNTHVRDNLTELRTDATALAAKETNVVQGSTATPSSTATDTTWVDSGLTVTITPTAAASQVLVTACFSFGAVYSGGAGIGAARLVRDATPLMTFARHESTQTGTVPAACTYLDSPATTSATVYKVQIQRVSGAGSSYVQAQINSETSVIVVQEIP